MLRTWFEEGIPTLGLRQPLLNVFFQEQTLAISQRKPGTLGNKAK